MRRRILWLIVSDALVGLACAAAIVGEVRIYRKLQAIERRLDAAEVPADVVAREIEELRARLSTLEKQERKASHATKAKKSKPLTEW